MGTDCLFFAYTMLSGAMTAQLDFNCSMIAGPFGTHTTSVPRIARPHTTLTKEHENDPHSAEKCCHSHWIGVVHVDIQEFNSVEGEVSQSRLGKLTPRTFVMLSVNVWHADALRVSYSNGGIHSVLYARSRYWVLRLSENRSARRASWLNVEDADPL